MRGWWRRIVEIEGGARGRNSAAGKAAKVSWPLVTSAVILSLAVQCDRISQDNHKGLKDLAGKHTNYKFELEQHVYLLAYKKSPQAPTVAEAEAIYYDAQRRAVPFAYVNMYDHEGDFYFQLYWDPAQRKFGTAQADFY